MQKKFWMNSRSFKKKSCWKWRWTIWIGHILVQEDSYVVQKMWPVYQLSILCLTDSYNHSPRNFFHIHNHRHWCQIFQSKPFYNWQNGIKWRCYVFCSTHSSLSTTGCNLVRFDHSQIGRPYQTWNFSQLFLLLEFTHFLFFSAPFTEYPCSSFRVFFCSLGGNFWDSEIF